MGADPGLTNHPLSRRVNLDDIAEALSSALRRGLPLTDVTAGVVLPHLRSVVARAIHADDPISRIDSLNKTLIRLIEDLGHERYAQPARILFGVAPGTSGTTLTQRCRAAALHLGYDIDHFRKRVEPAVVRCVAEAVYRDMLRYKKRATGGDQFPTYFNWMPAETDITVDEELACYVWKFAYAIRGEYVAIERQKDEPGYETRVAMHRRTARKYAQGLERAIQNYRGMFGPIIHHGNAEYRVEALDELMQWGLAQVSSSPQDEQEAPGSSK